MPSSRLIAATALLLLFHSTSVVGDDAKSSEGEKAFLQKHCVACHAGAKAEAGFRLDLPLVDLTDRATFDAWVKVHDKMSAGEMPPPDEPRPPADELRRLLEPLRERLIAADLVRQQTFGRTTFRRLNRVEFDYALRDLLALPHADFRDMLPADPSSHGFDVVGEALPMSYVQQAAYLQTAEAALTGAMTLKPRPERKLYSMSFLEIGGLAMPKTQTRPADGLALMSNFTLGPPFYFGHFVARASGRFHLKLRARTTTYHDGNLLDGEKPQVLMLYAEVGTSSRHVATFEAPIDRLADLEVTTWLYEGEWIRMIAPTMNLSAAPYQTNDRKLKYRGPAIAFHSFVGDGPIWDAWPPESHRRVLGEVPLVVPPRVTPPPLVPPPPLVTESADPPADAARLIERFAKSAFRRPVPAKEIERYIALARERLTAGAPLYEAVLTGYKGVLCSPDFLYFVERPGSLDDYALASRLSFFLWRSLPDEALLSAAAAGRLRDPKELHKQVERLLDDPRSERFVADFTDQWLDLREIGFTKPDEDLYPEYEDMHLIDSLVRETRAYFAEMLRGNLGVRYVVAGDFVCVNRTLAELYELPITAGAEARGIEIRKVKLPADHVRGGIITQASVLKVTANGTTTSPVPRGAWLMERIVGRPIPPPPTNVPAIEPDIQGATTVREQLSKHREAKACAGCHAKLDPPGFALESFDVLGAYRDRYRSLGKGDAVTSTFRGHKKKYRLGLPVDASGELDNGRKFQDIREYKRLLLQDEAQLARNLVERLTTFATGAPVQFADRRDVERIVTNLKDKNFGIRSLVQEVVASRMFHYK
ncbi:MAG: DUF1592 domain-containing protein [Planctomycetia bacterium]|nr:DUF1592 domain-containing protein [Planctomycetia bacterium]